MKKFLVFLFSLPLAAQTINPNQIRPSATNGQVLTTTGGQTVWGPGGGQCTGVLGHLTALGESGTCVGTPADYNVTNTSIYTSPVPWIYLSPSSTSVPVTIRGASGGGFATPGWSSGATNPGFSSLFICQIPSFTVAHAGDALVFYGVGLSGSPLSVGDGRNTYTIAAQNGANGGAFIAVAPNVSAGTVTITSVSMTEVNQCFVEERSGVDTVSPVDQATLTYTFGSPYPSTAGPITTTFANEAIITASMGVTNGVNPPSGYTANYSNPSAAQGAVFTASQNVSSTGTYSATWTSSVGGSVAQWTFMLGLKAAGSTAQTGDLIQYQTSTQTLLAGVNGQGQHYDPAASGLPGNTPSAGTYPWCMDTSAGAGAVVPCYWNGTAWQDVGAGSGNLTGTLTTNVYPIATGAHALGDGFWNYDGTNNVSTKPVKVNDGGGTSAATAVEGTAPSGVSGSDILWADATSHRWRQNPNNIGSLALPGVATPITAGHLFAAASNGIDMVDGGTGGGSDSGFGTLTVDVETAYSGANAGAKLIACLADTSLAPGTICDMRGILNEVTQPASLGTAPIEVGRSGPQAVLWPSCDGPTNSFCGAVVNTASTTLATPSAPTISCSTSGGNYHSAGVTFFAKVNYRTGDAVSASSTEVSCTLASTTTGSVTVTGPASCPTYTSEYDVTMSLTTGAETLQMNQACGSAAVFTNQDLFPVSSAAPSAATALPSFIIHNNKSQFYALFTGQTGFPFYTSGSTVATDMLATTDNGYSAIANIFLYNNGGGTIAHGMADNGVYAGSIRDHITIGAGSVNGMNIFGQVNDVTYNLPNFGCTSNSCDPLNISWWPQTVGDGESLATLNFNGMLISTKANASNTGNGIRITGRPSTGSTFWQSVGSGVEGININGSSLEMGASAANGILATDFTGLNINGTKITRASFGGTAAVNINQTWNHSGQPYQSGNVSIDNASHIESFTDVVLNNVSTDPAATIAGTSGVSFDVPYKWGGGTSSLASPDYSYTIADMPVVYGLAAPITIGGGIVGSSSVSGGNKGPGTINMLGCFVNGVACATGGSGLSGMTAGQVPIAATATTVTSSKVLAGSGTGIVTGPTTSTSGDLASYTGTGGQIADSGILASAVLSGAQYKIRSCQPGYGDGTNAITAATYLQTECYNDSGVTWTITGIRCFTDNSGSSTMNVTNGAGTSLLTGSVTCTSSFASGTQSATVTIASGDFLKFTFVADGTSKQSTFVITGTI